MASARIVYVHMPGANTRSADLPKSDNAENRDTSSVLTFRNRHLLYKTSSQTLRKWSWAVDP